MDVRCVTHNVIHGIKSTGPRNSSISRRKHPRSAMRSRRGLREPNRRRADEAEARNERIDDPVAPIPRTQKLLRARSGGVIRMLMRAAIGRGHPEPRGETRERVP